MGKLCRRYIPGIFDSLCFECLGGTSNRVLELSFVGKVCLDWFVFSLGGLDYALSVVFAGGKKTVKLIKVDISFHLLCCHARNTDTKGISFFVLIIISKKRAHF